MTIILLSSVLTFSAKERVSSSITKLFSVGWKLTSIESLRGFVEKVGITLKFFNRCFILSIGCWRSIPLNNNDARSSMLVTCCMLRKTNWRPDCSTAFLTRLVLPNRRGLMTTRWFLLFRISAILDSSSTLSVKYGLSTTVPNLKGFSIFRYFSFRYFSQ